MRWTYLGVLFGLGTMVAAPAAAADDDRDDDDRVEEREYEHEREYQRDVDEDDDAVDEMNEGRVDGTGRLGAAYGSPELHVNVRGDRTDADGRFFIDYPNRGRITGEPTCLNIIGDTAWIVGQIEDETGNVRRFADDDFVVIAIRDIGEDDLVNYSPGLDEEPMCGPSSLAMPEIPLTSGNFNVGAGPARVTRTVAR